MKKQMKTKKKIQIKPILNKIKDFFNKPAPIIIVLIFFIFALLLYIEKDSKKDKILIGSLSSDAVTVQSIHYFTNGDMNYFYATPAVYSGNEKVYSFQIGYYVVDDDGNYTEFVTRSDTLDNPSSLYEIVSEKSGWDFGELDMQEYLFDRDVKANIENLHFVIKASTEKDSSEADIVVDEEVDVEKITK